MPDTDEEEALSATGAEANANPWTHPRWIVALIGALAALFGVVGPLADHVRGEAELQRQRDEHRQDFVMAILGADTPVDDKIALLRFLQIEYPDEPIRAWSDEEIARLESEITRQLSIKDTQQSSTTSTAEKVALSSEISALEAQLEATRGLHQMEIEKLESDADPVDGETNRAHCPSVSFRIWKPFAADRPESDYPDDIRQEIRSACLARRPSERHAEWRIWVSTPEEGMVGKRAVCVCEAAP